MLAAVLNGTNKTWFTTAAETVEEMRLRIARDLKVDERCVRLRFESNEISRVVVRCIPCMTHVR